MNQPFSEDDEVIKAMMGAAKQYIEDKCNISIGEQEREVVLSTDGDARYLPSQPLIEINEVSYTNCDCMDFSVADAASYSVMGGGFSTFKGQPGYWKITYTAGYKPIPESLKTLIKAVTLSMYEQRGDSSWSLPAWVKDQMKQYSRKTWF